MYFKSLTAGAVFLMNIRLKNIFDFFEGKLNFLSNKN
ncbi:hypothetical protein CHY_1715 [Carboxydothermus hydrogenoformans Z-2901]|uniref:Uncharacterized protein n=1 Tax=Carboxydothermus hydrogenoformans (strain ATCC BAA-161 / DSM 6008 / Z-2901) TaxID=246194 RepID=Q3ABE9_CARHZ|nr:hypothetical protein CHY_1715 [Carboxydothermus hydrogenoformans Z-2901]